MVIFAANEPCTMCVGALLESDVDGLVFALPDPAKGAAGSSAVSTADALRRRVRVVSGIMQAEAAELAAPVVARQEYRLGSSGILSDGEVSEWLMVPLSKSGVRKHRGFESHPLRHSPLSDTARRGRIEA